MTIWHIILIASAATLALKLAGYLVPPGSSSANGPRASPTCSRSRCSPRSSPCRRSAAGQAIVIDARVPAVIVAAALFALRVPFIVVVIVAAAVAAGIRAFS